MQAHAVGLHMHAPACRAALLHWHPYTHLFSSQVAAWAPISNVYNQGWNTSLFTLSLPRNYRRGYKTDFSRVEGLPGVLLANQLGKDVLASQPGRWGLPDYDGSVQTKVSLGRWE